MTELKIVKMCLSIPVQPMYMYMYVYSEGANACTCTCIFKVPPPPPQGTRHRYKAHICIEHAMLGLYSVLRVPCLKHIHRHWGYRL